jgi:hypothetical protein
MIFCVCQVFKAAELRNRRRPEIIGALYDFGDVGRKVFTGE